MIILFLPLLPTLLLLLNRILYISKSTDYMGKNTYFLLKLKAPFCKTLIIKQLNFYTIFINFLSKDLLVRQ